MWNYESYPATVSQASLVQQNMNPALVNGHGCWATTSAPMYQAQQLLLLQQMQQFQQIQQSQQSQCFAQIQQTQQVLLSQQYQLQLYQQANLIAKNNNIGAPVNQPTGNSYASSPLMGSNGGRQASPGFDDVDRVNKWLHRGVNTNKPITRIIRHELEQANCKVTATPARLISTYNTLSGKNDDIVVGGTAPTWKNVALPLKLSKDDRQGISKVPDYPFQPAVSAAISMNPNFKLDDVDIVINRGDLRKLLKYTTFDDQGSFRMNLYMVKNTLFIESGTRGGQHWGSSETGWGHKFEKAFTSYPEHLQKSSAHMRTLVYNFGNLRMAVLFEVDARYEDVQSATADASALATQMTMPQSTAAELKTVQGNSSFDRVENNNFDQLWFGRTPWLIMGRHTNGTFKEVEVRNLSDYFEGFAKQYQDCLRKMVTVLTRLRAAVKTTGGKKCVALYRDTIAANIHVFRAEDEDEKALPEELIAKCWTSTNTTC